MANDRDHSRTAREGLPSILAKGLSVLRRCLFSFLTLGWVVTTAVQIPSASGEPAPKADPKQILRELLEGNQRFLKAGVSRHHMSKSWLEQLSGAQHPRAIVLGCSDSRVPPELLFDEGFGDLFVVRVAGNVVDLDVAASVEYAVLHTGAQLILVLGHEECGAVTAALSDYHREALPIQYLLKQIVPALGDLPRNTEPATVSAGVDRNVRQSVLELRSLPCFRNQPGILIQGAVYEIKTGRVRLVADP